MRLSAKITSALFVVLALSIVLHVILFRTVIFRGFVRLEEDEARRSMRRCIAALDSEIEHLRMITVDWAQWDDSYRFMQDRNEAFIEANLLSESFVDNDLSLICYYDEDGVLVWGGAHDAEKGEDMELGEFSGPLGREHPLMALGPATNSVAGILATTLGPMLSVSSRILTSDTQGPSRGRLVMGRPLDDAMAESLGGQVDAELEIMPIEEGPALQGAKSGPADLPRDGTPVILERSSDSLLVGATLADLCGNPVLLVRMAVPRVIAARATVAMYYGTLSVAAVGLLILLAILVLLRHLVVGPASALADNVLAVRQAGKITSPMASDRDDELGMLSREFERTLAELTDAKGRAEKASRAKTDFLNVVSHELRTPLGGVIGLAALIASSPGEAKCAEWAQRIVSETESLQALLDELLDGAKAEAGKLQIEVQPFSPLQLLKDLQVALAARAQSRGLAFELRPDPALPDRVLGDSQRIRQVLMNLADNAMKFTERGSVRIDAAVLESTVDEVLLRFAVVDTGVGIPREKQSAIFEDFVQVYDDMARKYGGSGLGTSVSRQLVRRMGGDMGLDSKEGRGSTFWFTLRLPHANKPAARAQG